MGHEVQITATPLIAYSLSEAARAASLEVQDIEVAVNTGFLIARRHGAHRLVILASDLTAWLEGLPKWRADFPPKSRKVPNGLTKREIALRATA